MRSVRVFAIAASVQGRQRFFDKNSTSYLAVNRVSAAQWRAIDAYYVIENDILPHAVT